MDPISIIVGLVVIAGVFAFVSNKRGSKSEAPVAVKAKAPAKAATPTKKSTASARVQALKSTDAVKADAAPVAKKLPTKTALLKATKADIETTARTYGIELDARKTKDNMVAEFLKTAKAQAKAAIK